MFYDDEIPKVQLPPLFVLEEAAFVTLGDVSAPPAEPSPRCYFGGTGGDAGDGGGKGDASSGEAEGGSADAGESGEGGGSA